MMLTMYVITVTLTLFFLYKFKQEISYRKQVEKKLKDSEALYAELNETIIDVIWRTDKDYFFTYISPSVEHILGFKPEELIGCHVFKIFSDNSIAVSMENMEQRKKDASQGIFSAYSILEIEHKSKDGSFVWGEVVSKVKLDENDNVISYHGISRNITNHKEMKKEKEVLFRELEHRVKNNLQIISSIVFLHSSKEDTSKALEDIHKTISAISLAQDKLHHNTTYNTLEIKNYINDLLDNLLSSSILKIQKEVNSKDIYLNAQQSITLGIIINEFINNSIKYAFINIPLPKITVDIKEDKNFLTIIISDNGIGINEETKKTGLGMQIMKTLAKSKFKTEVLFYNNNGTCMELKIPLKISKT